MSINSYLTPRNNFAGPTPLVSHSSASMHARQRTSSSGAFPAPGVLPSLNAQQLSPHQSYHYYPTPKPQKQRSGSTSTGSSSSQLQRSGSTTTTASSSVPVTAPRAASYVAALRRQKATVWCERSQPEDVLVLASQKETRLTVAGGSSSSGGVGGGGGAGLGHGVVSGPSSASLRISARTYHKLGKSGPTSNSSSAAIGLGVGSLVSPPPPRLSATEATGDSSDDDDQLYMGTHRRSTSGSGRSSLNSNHHPHPRPHRSVNRASTMYSSGHRNSSASDVQRRLSSRSASSSNSPNRSSADFADPMSRAARADVPHALPPPPPL